MQPFHQPFHFTLTFQSYPPEEIVEIGRHIAAKEKIASGEDSRPLLAAEASRLRSVSTDSGTAPAPFVLFDDHPAGQRAMWAE